MVGDKKKGLIKVKSKYVVIFMTFTISCFLMAIYFSNKRAEKYGIADYGTEIQPTFLKGGLSFGEGRGGLYFKNDTSVSLSSTYIEGSSNFTGWQNNGPIIDFDSIPYIYCLSDVPFPFTISKKKNNDTIVIRKGNYTLKFKLYLEEEEPLRTTLFR